MEVIYKLFIVPILTVIISILGTFFSPCDTCDSKVTLPCDECGGKGYIYNDEYEVEVVCGNCGAAGEVNCPECSDLAKIYYSFKNELEEYK